MGWTMNDAEIIRRMTQAGVPRTCWNVSTSNTGRMHLKAFAESMKTRKADRELNTVALIRGSADNSRTPSMPLLDTEMMAKELVLAGILTRYLPFSVFCRELRINERHMPEGDRLAEVFGVGAFVIPDMVLNSDATPDQIEAVDFLTSHAYQGGVLVMAVPTRRPAHWPQTLTRLLTESATIFEAQ